MHKIATPTALVAGIALGFLIRPLVSPEASTAPDTTGGAVAAPGPAGEEPPSAATTGASAPSALESGRAADRGARPSATRGIDDGAGAGFDPTSLIAAMEKQQQERDERRTELKVAEVGAALALDDRQAESLRALLKDLAQGRRGGLASLIGAAGSGDAEAITAIIGGDGAAQAPAEEAFLAQLSPEQTEAYESYLERQRANAAEATANRELAHLQSLFSLSEEQKDAAFEAFAAAAAESSDSDPVFGPPAGADLGAALAMGERKRELLEPILSEAQMAVYRESPSVMQAFTLPAGTGSGGQAIFHIESAVDLIPPPPPNSEDARSDN